MGLPSAPIGAEPRAGGGAPIFAGSMRLPSMKNWELYDVASDRIEAHDLANDHPEIVEKLSKEYDQWAALCGVIARSELQARRQGGQAPAAPALEDR